MKKYLIFALLGYAVGTLYAPKKGSLLRKELKDCFSDMHKNGAETLEKAQCKSLEIAAATSLAFERAKEESRTLKCQGEEIVRSASLSLQHAYEKGQSTLHLVGERVADKAIPVITQVKVEAHGLKNQVDDYFSAKKVRCMGEQGSQASAKRV